MKISFREVLSMTHIHFEKFPTLLKVPGVTVVTIALHSCIIDVAVVSGNDLTASWHDEQGKENAIGDE